MYHHWGNEVQVAILKRTEVEAPSFKITFELCLTTTERVLNVQFKYLGRWAPFLCWCIYRDWLFALFLYTIQISIILKPAYPFLSMPISSWILPFLLNKGALFFLYLLIWLFMIVTYEYKGLDSHKKDQGHSVIFYELYEWARLDSKPRSIKS